MCPTQTSRPSVGRWCQHAGRLQSCPHTVGAGHAPPSRWMPTQAGRIASTMPRTPVGRCTSWQDRINYAPRRRGRIHPARLLRFLTCRFFPEHAVGTPAVSGSSASTQAQEIRLPSGNHLLPMAVRRGTRGRGMPRPYISSGNTPAADVPPVGWALVSVCRTAAIMPSHRRGGACPALPLEAA